MNWDEVGAIGQVLGSIAVFINSPEMTPPKRTMTTIHSVRLIPKTIPAMMTRSAIAKWIFMFLSRLMPKNNP